MTKAETIPNEKLMEEAEQYDKFEITGSGLTHWYVNPDGNTPDGSDVPYGILQEDCIAFWLIAECLDIYYMKGSEEDFWTHWDDEKVQRLHDNVADDELFTESLETFIALESAYTGTPPELFVEEVYHAETKESFAAFIDWLKELAAGENIMTLEKIINKIESAAKVIPPLHEAESGDSRAFWEKTVECGDFCGHVVTQKNIHYKTHSLYVSYADCDCGYVRIENSVPSSKETTRLPDYEKVVFERKANDEPRIWKSGRTYETFVVPEIAAQQTIETKIIRVQRDRNRINEKE